jgi:hypothetical protein
MRFSARSKRPLRLLAIAAGVGAMVAVPAAAARSDATVQLSVLPLPAASLGPAAKSLRLQRDSGADLSWAIPLDPNRQHIFPSVDVGAPGRVGGYALDYGRGASGRFGITEVSTSVAEYGTSDDATNVLASWKRLETGGFLRSKVSGVLSVTNKAQKAAPVGDRHFAALAVYKAGNIAPVFGLDEQFSVGSYEADVTVWAGSAAAAKKLAPRLAKRLDTRIKRAIAGQLDAKPVDLPPQAGRPGGPDLAPLGLKTSDLSAPATEVYRGYLPAPDPFSDYLVQVAPAGPFANLVQTVSWYPTRNEARFYDDFWADQFGQASLNLSGVGDGARGYLYYYKEPGGLAHLFFSSGRIDEQVFLQGNPSNPIQASQVESIAPIVAHYINAAGYGSAAHLHRATVTLSGADHVPACGTPCVGPGISVWKKGSGSGTVSSVPGGLHCGKTCSHVYGPGTSVTLTAAPAAWSRFAGWSGTCDAYSTCCFGTRTCMVPATSHGADVVATFARIPHCGVPRVRGKVLAAADHTIRSRDCSVGRITYRASWAVPKGHVIAQTPKPGAQLTHGAKVSLVVSKGAR